MEDNERGSVLLESWLEDFPHPHCASIERANIQLFDIDHRLRVSRLMTAGAPGEGQPSHHEAEYA